MQESGLLLVVTLALASSGEGVEFHGSLSERLEGTLVREGALMSTRDLPQLRSISEANLQGTARLLDEKLSLYADASAFYLTGGAYLDTDLESGKLERVDAHDVAALRPRMVFSEAYLGLEPTERLRITAGKKRVTWGYGQHTSPTDVLNPPRDPTDPAFQREGTLLVLVDIPFESFTLSGLFSPAVLYQESGIPYAVLEHPTFPPAESALYPEVFADPRDGELHYAAALRAYLLLFDTDVNAWLVYSNLYRDRFEDKLRLAASVSRNVFEIHEVHMEVLAHTGTSRAYANDDCLDDGDALVRCQLTGTAVLDATKLESDDWFPDILLGTRSFFDDGSVLSLEYLYQADGYTKDELESVVVLQSLVGDLQRRGMAPASASPIQAGGEVPTRFTFDPLRRHYLFASYMKPQLFDDWTVSATLITAVEDLSSIASGSVVWAAEEWLSLALFAFVPLPSLSRASSWLDDDPLAAFAEESDEEVRDFLPLAPTVGGVPYGEYDAVPFDGRVMAEVRFFF